MEGSQVTKVNTESGPLGDFMLLLPGSVSNRHTRCSRVENPTERGWLMG
jgi:hypothetical protein